MTDRQLIHPLLPSDEEGEDGARVAGIAGAAWRRVGATTGRVSMSGPAVQHWPREPRGDFTGLEARVQSCLTQAMAVDLDRMVLLGTGAPTPVADTAPQDRTPRAREDLYDSIRYLYMSSETIAEARALQDASDEPVEGMPPRRLIRIRRT